MSNFIHFYWAGGKIPYMVKKNIIHWAQHLKDTEFVPVLWTNDSVFKEMQTQIESEKNKATLTIGDPVYHLLVKENNIKRNTIEKLNKITDLKSEGKLLWKPRSSLLDSGRSCYIIIINAETYLNEIANRDNSGKVLKENVESIKLCYQLANENKLFALMKDKFIPFIISHFGGFYFDADIKPKLETAFFKNMADVIGLDTNNKMEFNALGGKNPLLYKLLKFDNDDDTPGVLDKSNVLHEDVGFYFCPNPTKIKDPSGNYVKFVESDTEKLSLLKDFKEGLDRYTKLSKLKKDQNKEKGILDISKEWIDCYGQDKYDAAINLYEKSGSLVINEDSIEKMLYEKFFEKFYMHLCNLLKSGPKIIGAALMACRSGKSKDDKKLCKKYEEFYKDHFYNKFEQLYHAEPSSFHYTCYQKIVSYENAANVIWEQYSKIYSAQMKKNKLLQSEKNTPQIFEGFEINNKKEIGSVKQKDL